jgi:hypothetical protein
MRRFAALAFLAIAVPETKSQAVLPTCGGSFTDVEAILYPSTNLNVGEDAYFYLSYTAPTEVTDGYTITTLNVNGVPFPENRANLCETNELGSSFSIWRDDDFSLSDQGNACPITVGTHATNSSFSVPDVDGQLKSKIAWFSPDGEMLLCIKMIVNVAQAVVW